MEGGDGGAHRAHNGPIVCCHMPVEEESREGGRWVDKSKERWIGRERERARGVKRRRWGKIRTVGKCKREVMRMKRMIDAHY